MGVGDIIMIVTLLVAIIAIVGARDRRYLVLKIGKKEWVIGIIGVLFMHYFVFYNEFHYYGIYLECMYFDGYGIMNPNHYAYLITSLLFLFFLYKITKGFLPANRRDIAISYYKGLIEQDDITHLCNLIEKYHLDDIIKYFRKKRELVNSKYFFQPEKKSTKDIVGKEFIRICWIILMWFIPGIRKNRMIYAKNVLWHIIGDKRFIKKAANKRPYLFVRIISECTIERKYLYPNDFVNTFIEEIIKNKNEYFLEELDKSMDFDISQPERFFEENVIISSLIKDVSVADANEIWRPFGECAINELKEEKHKNESSFLAKKHTKDEYLKYAVTYNSVRFFNSLIIASIIQGYKESHFWLHYYYNFIDGIESNIQKVSFAVVGSRYLRLIEIIQSNTLHWLDLCHENIDSGKYYDICYCMGMQLYVLSRSDYYPKASMLQYIDCILRLYCNLDNYESVESINDLLDNCSIGIKELEFKKIELIKGNCKTLEEIYIKIEKLIVSQDLSENTNKRLLYILKQIGTPSNRIRAQIEKVLVNPIMGISKTHKYFVYMKDAWKKFDKIPYRGYSMKVDSLSFKRLKEKVIGPLGLDVEAN